MYPSGSGHGSGIDWESGSAWVDSGEGRLGLAVRISQRARSVRVREAREGLELVLPARISKRKAESALQELSWWVREHGSQIVARREAASDGPLRWLGQEVAVRWIPSARRRVDWREEMREARVASPQESEARELALASIRSHASALLRGMAQEEARRTGLQPSRVSVRDQRSKWGSCARTGAVSLNWRLAMAPESVARYIVLHELAHLREMNHGPGFWSLVAEICPSWKEGEAWIKKHGSDLMRVR